MKLLSGRARVELWKLQAALRTASVARSSAIRVLLTSRNVATPSAQREYWLEFAWMDQEYRATVRALLEFCTRRGPR